METQLLRDSEIFPSAEVLKETLGNDIYDVFKSFMDTVTGAEYGLTHEWNYYNDGKSWLCKVSNKKKTTFWLSVWEGYFQIGFFFTEKHLEGIAELDIAESIKEDFCKAKPIGKLLPMIFKISRKEQLDDLQKVMAFKKSLK
ncbi:MAG TPA: DUF3788 family protein [Clostridia bacterium]|nr:DUF3788 family protein [Clostridia bacterium]